MNSLLTAKGIFVTPLLEWTCYNRLIQKQQSCLTRVPTDKILWPCFNKNVCHEEASKLPLEVSPFCQCAVLPLHLDSTAIPSTHTQILNSLQKLLFFLFLNFYHASLTSVINQSSWHTKHWRMRDKAVGACDLCFVFTTAQHTTSCYFLITKSLWKLCNPTGVNAILWQQTHMKGTN